MEYNPKHCYQDAEAGLRVQVLLKTGSDLWIRSMALRAAARLQVAAAGVVRDGRVVRQHAALRRHARPGEDVLDLRDTSPAQARLQKLSRLFSIPDTT